MELRFDSDGFELVGHLARPERRSVGRLPGLVICHGFPSGAAGPSSSVTGYLALADRIAQDLGWVVLAVNYRGCGGSEGNFSLRGWYDDTCAAVEWLAGQTDVGAVWIAGFGTGGALGICAGANDDRVRGVAAVAPPADFDDWCRNPRRLLLHSRRLDLIHSDDWPASFDDWAAELGTLKAVDSAPMLAPRPLLLIHGADDEAVPVFDSRVIADAHGNADLRVIGSAGHALRYDPRAVAVLLGWLDRQRHRTPL
ncbi:MAG: alpha/beta fold hydrolase [Acidimicrobiia bacterium]|nr:alpha/beta fold hydrolase [Acidimicrobiia bacterium]